MAKNQKFVPVLAVLNMKGGVGKTTLSANTQLLAARKQVAVRLADFMSDNLSSGIKDAIKTIDLHIKKDGVARAEEALMKVQLLLDWANYLYVSERTGHCNEFIDGLRSSLVETIFCVSTGLARLALFSMRGQIDIALSWLYFKDHPVEYRKVFRSSDGFMLKSSVISYLEEYEPKFKKRFQALSSNMTRQEKDPYKFLSAHVHSQSHMTLPAASSFESMVVKPEVTKELLLAQENVTEYLNDVLLSVFGSKWAGLPASVVNAVKARLSGDALAAVFS